MKRATEVSKVLVTIVASLFLSLLAFETINLGSALIGWQAGLILELTYICAGMFFIWQFRHYLKHKLHL